MDCRNCENKRCFINQYCVDNWLDFTQVVKKVSNYTKGNTIFSEGDSVEGIHIICSGKVKLNMELENNSKEIVRLAGSGQLLGHRGFSYQMRYPVSAETLENSEIAHISNEDFMKLLRKNPDLALALILFYSSELMKDDQKLKISNLGSDRQKVKFALQNAYDAFKKDEGENQSFELGTDIEEFASFAGVLPEDLIEILDDLKKESILKLDGERVLIKEEQYFVNEIVADK